MTSVTLTRAEYDSLLERIEDLEDAAELRDATARGRTNEALSAASVKRIVAGEHPLRVWRAHRGLSLTALARRAGIAASYVSEIESGKKPGSIAALKKFATALGIGVDDLVG